MERERIYEQMNEWIYKMLYMITYITTDVYGKKEYLKSIS